MIHPLAAQPDTPVRRAAALRRAAVHAAQAPSVLNTQPWKFRIRDGVLFVHADHDRQLPAMDPQRRVLTTSVGCAVFSARAALAADGYGTVVRRFPDPRVPHLVATIEPAPDLPADTTLPLPDAGPWPLPGYGHEPHGVAADIPRPVLETLRADAAAEGVQLLLLDDLERGLVAELNRQADEIENLDPTYRAELDAWTADDRHHRDRTAEPDECLAMIVTGDDRPSDWLRSGEAMMRAVQSAAHLGHVLSPSTQVVEVASARAQLRRALGLSGHAHVLLRAGRAYGSTVTRRRRLVDVLIEES